MLKFKANMARSVVALGQIHNEMLGEVMPAIEKLDGKRSPDGIHMYLISGGGSMSSALALFDFLMARKNHIITIGSGECSSAAVLLMQAGKKRWFTPHTECLLHPVATDMESQQLVAKEMDRISATIKRMDDTYLNILLERAHFGCRTYEAAKAKAKAIIAEATFITPREALSFGIIDGITYRPTYERALGR